VSFLRVACVRLFGQHWIGSRATNVGLQISLAATVRDVMRQNGLLSSGSANAPGNASLTDDCGD
jgi:hypothetical protein